MTYKLDTDSMPRRACAKCGGTMPDFGHDRCATCTYGPTFGTSSSAARTAIEAHALTPRGATHPRETAPALRQRVGSPRRQRRQAVEVIRSVLLT